MRPDIPEDVKMENRAKNDKNVYTGEPLTQEDTPSHPVTVDVLSGAGAYSGPTIGPGPGADPNDGKRPVALDFFDNGDEPSGFSSLTKVERDELAKTREQGAVLSYGPRRTYVKSEIICRE
ncbi:MAG: hypothetical protein EOP04_04430 [Proteobacteria bacterium]|nr:MAG: hypothetical protein EOP04_04430 [Pseudomonadota bacterium]